jgi:ent-kaurene oxidase
MQGTNCYLKHLLSEETLTEEHLISLVWEVIIEASDTTAISTEWAMYQLAKNPDCQVHLNYKATFLCYTRLCVQACSDVYVDLIILI